MFTPFKTMQRTMQRALGRFAKARGGSTAIEFGLVAVPFFMLMIGVAEVGMVGFTQTNLDFALAARAREIRTGEAQQGGVTYDEIQTSVCADMRRLMVIDCENNLFLDIDSFDSFVDAAANFNNPIINGEFQPGGFGYSPGAASEIVVVRAYYRWSVLTPLFENVFSNAGNGDRILVSTAMFRNEPFQ